MPKYQKTIIRCANLLKKLFKFYRKKINEKYSKFYSIFLNVKLNAY